MRIAFSVRLAVTALGMVGAAAPGRAQEPQGRWSGFYLGAGGGLADVSSNVRLEASNTTTTYNTCEIVANNQPGAIFQDNFNVTCVGDQNPENPALNALFPNTTVGTISSPFNLTSAIVNQLNSLTSGEAQWQGSLLVGFDQHISPSVVAGLFADVSWNGAENNFSASNPVASITGRLHFDYLATAGARLGWVVPNKNGLIYAYGGYTFADAGGSQATVTTSDGSSIFRPDMFQGFSVGGGGEVQLGKGWFGRLDYRYTHLYGQRFDFKHANSSTVPDGVFAACAGPSGPVGVDCQRYKTTDSTTTGSARIYPDVHAVQMIFGYRF